MVGWKCTEYVYVARSRVRKCRGRFVYEPETCALGSAQPYGWSRTVLHPRHGGVD